MIRDIKPKTMLQEIKNRILAGGEITPDEAIDLALHADRAELYAAADEIRRKFCNRTLDSCSIINARSGHCPENCKWCAQSAHYNTRIETYDAIPEEEAMTMARLHESQGIKRLSLVTSGRSVRGTDLDYFCNLYRRMGRETHLQLCASMGLLKREELQKLKEAKRPLILAGGGVNHSSAQEQLRVFAETMNIPVITSLMGKSSLPESHPLCLGVNGTWGHYPAVEAARNADIILALGCRFNDLHTATWQPGFAYNFPVTKLIQVDIDASEIARNYPVDVGVVGDIRTVLTQLIDMAQEKQVTGDYTVWHQEIAGYRKEWGDFITPYGQSDADPIDPRRLITDIRKVAPKDAIMFSDVGNNQPWVEQYWTTEVPNTHFTAGGFAAMGFGVVGVLGAKLARPETTCINVCGDGGFMMMPHAVATAVQYNLPCVWIVMNNYAIGAIRDLQKFYYGGRIIGTSFEKYEGRTYHDGELWNPDFAAMARSMGGQGVTVTKPGEIAGAVEHAIQSGLPTVIDVKIDRDITVPLTTTWQMPPIPPALPTFGKIKVR